MENPVYLQKVMNYFKDNLKKGYTMEALKWSLIHQGYSLVLVEKAIKEVIKEQALEAPLLKDKPLIKHEMIDEKNQPIQIKKPWWKKIFGL